MNDRTDIRDLAERFFGKSPHSLDAEEARVLGGISDRQPISRDIVGEEDERATFWEKLADKVAAVGGSWAFIFTFAAVLFGWMLLNTDILARWHMQFDPYPYIFLNLMLSMLAAIQAPVIMMSQNRQGAKDRRAAAHDYEVNLRAELEILRLHEKIDALREEQVAVLARSVERLAAVIEQQERPPQQQH